MRRSMLASFILFLVAAPAASWAAPTVAYTINPKHRIVEGLASDGSTLFVSSILDRTIIACRETCDREFTLAGPAVPLGISWDPKRKLLWVAMHCPKLPGVAPCSGEVQGVTAKGKLRYRLWPGADFSPGDLNASDGRLFVSDSANGKIYLAEPEAGRWTELGTSGERKSGQGVALDSGGRLIAADYSKGISAVDLATGTRTMLPRAGDKPLRGIDGMVAAKGRIFAIYNGQAPGALLELAPGPDGLKFGQLSGDTDLPDPTQVTVIGDSLYAVADAGWATIEKEPARAKGATILKFAIPPQK